MRTLTIIATWAIVGSLLGAALAYVQVGIDPDAIGKLPGDTSDAEVLVAKESAPRVQVDNPTYDFGKMQRGTTKSHEFVFRNVGKSPLTLRVGPTSCKCTLGEVDDKPIPPGGSAKVKLEWSAKSDSGPFSQTATIYTSDPFQHQVDLTVTGHIMATSGVEPPEIVFDKMKVGESKSAVVYVMAMLQDGLEVSDPVLSDPATRDQFDVKIEPVDTSELPNKQARRGVRVTLTTKGDLPIGRFNQWLSLKTNLPEAESLDIPILGRVVGDISVHGPRWNEDQGVLVIGNVASAEGAKEKINIIVRGEAAADVKFELKSKDPEELQVTIGEAQPLKPTLVHVPVEIEVPPGTRPMVHMDTPQGEAGKIILSTTHPKIKDLSVGVRFSVQR